MKSISALGLSLLLAATACAGDYYVDAAAGSNTTGDGSQQSPWQTITHALSRVPLPAPAGGHRVHVLPGFHETRMGEQFPITIPAGVALLGAGHDRTLIYGDGKSGEPLLQFAAGASMDNVLSGLGLHGGDPAVLVPSSAGAGPGPVVRDCRLSWNLSAMQFEGPTLGSRDPLVERCGIASNSVLGIRVEGRASGSVGGRIRACRFDYNSTVALHLQGAAGDIATVVESCAMMDTAGDAILFVGAATSTPLFTHVTVHASTGAGFRLGSGSSAAGLRIRNSIFHSNQGADLADVPAPAVSHCCFLTTTGVNPPQGQQNGNLQADPKFLVAGEPDLSPFSPVIDRAAFSVSVDPVTDFAGRPRTADGDGDSVHAPDPGALEYQPLRDDGPAPMPGGVTSLDLDLPSNVSIPYSIGLSFTDTGIPVAGKRTIRLWPDPLLALVLNGQLPFVVNFVGQMNGSGFARAHIQWPNDARLKGLVVFTAAITLQPGFPGGVRCVTNGVKLSL